MDLLNYYFQLVNLIAGIPLSAAVLPAKIISALVGVAALYWYLSTIFKINALGAAEEIITVPDKAAAIQEIVAQPWVEVQEKMASSNAADWALAVIQADAVLDKILKASGYIGDTMGDRLRQVNSAELEAIDDIWRSHKIRNRLAHGTEMITRAEAEEAIRGFEKAFRELNYI